MDANSSTMGQRNGLSQEFERGRLYERRETLAYLADVLNVSDIGMRDSLLRVWATELARDLKLPTKNVVVIEDTYIIL